MADNLKPEAKVGDRVEWVRKSDAGDWRSDEADAVLKIGDRGTVVTVDPEDNTYQVVWDVEREGEVNYWTSWETVRVLYDERVPDLRGDPAAISAWLEA